MAWSRFVCVIGLLLGSVFSSVLVVAQQLAMNHKAGCVVRSNGALRCWGLADKFGYILTLLYEENGQNSLWKLVTGSSLPHIRGRQFRSVRISTKIACAIDVAGTATCWGPGIVNYAYNTTATIKRVYVVNLRQPDPLVKYIDLVPNSRAFCGIVDDKDDPDRVICTGGFLYDYELSFAEATRRGLSISNTVAAAPAALRFVIVDISDPWNCGITAGDRAIVCWGYAYDAQPGLLRYERFEHTMQANGTRFSSLTVSQNVCGLDVAGSLFCNSGMRPGLTANAALVMTRVRFDGTAVTSFSSIAKSHSTSRKIVHQMWGITSGTCVLRVIF
jgi:hypothetical protein